MSSITLKMTAEAIQSLADQYPQAKMEKAPHAYYRLRINGTIITAYHSGKVLFQGSRAEEEAHKWQSSDQIESSHLKKSPPSKPKPTNHYQGLNLIGSDEVGNGSYFGALTVCAVYLNQAQIQTLKDLGIQDSKNLTDAKIQSLSNQIQDQVCFHLTIINPNKYNQLTQKYNANAIKAIAHNYTLNACYQKLSTKDQKELDGALIDQFTPERNYYQHLEKQGQSIYPGKTFFAKKAESLHLSVACASIIARDYFLQSLDKLGAPYNCVLPSGASQSVDQMAAQLIRDYGPEALEKTAKLHFSNTQKALRLAGQSLKK